MPSQDNFIYLVEDQVFFHPLKANIDGLLGVSEYLIYDDLVTAYRFGIFPLNNPTDPILWWSPDPRWVLNPTNINISKSMRKIMKELPWRVTCDTAFQTVMKRCAESKFRKDKEPSWITTEYIDIYTEFYTNGRGHSFEVWNSTGELIGGLYGVITGKIFSGESMFSEVSNTSKYAFILACEFLAKKGIVLIDCQMHSNHLESLGAYPVSREDYFKFIRTNGFDVPELLINQSDSFNLFMQEKVNPQNNSTHYD